MPNFYVIHNPHAGNGEHTAVTNNIRNMPNVIEWFDTEYPDHAIYLAKNLAKTLVDAEAVVLVIGGDGTLNETLNGLLQIQRHQYLPIAYIPTGTGNDFARACHIGSSDEVINRLQQIVKPKMINVGKIIGEAPHQTTQYFINNMGMGFDAAVVAQTNHSKWKTYFNKLHFGAMSYAFTAFSTFFNQNSFPVTITNGEEYYHLHQVFLATIVNQPYFGGGLAILPQADLFKEQLDMIVVEKMSFIHFLTLFIGLKKDGRHLKDQKVHHFTLQKGAQIHVHDIQPGQLDGEELGNGSFIFTTTLQTYPFWI
ncbi:diacylglycerol kinase family lipid kinase [Leuconostoc citreum]|uniref:diacylglycerol/lipid kinase family protein n=1 Tax=Leuconostoc citreum TaxID=33964 RepID=UPI00200B566A|nr:diacylglycerol kinase family protein [Leuconostoc citreum]MCK8604736.1 diacylglycerol kinase family lipid kinase [Leuconostoc citreum]